MIFSVQWAKHFELINTQTKWYSERWERGHVLENSRAKLVWDFGYHLRKKTTYRRPDLTLEDKERKIWLGNIACPQEDNINIKTNGKQTKYHQLVSEMRERRIGYKVIVLPIIIGCLGGGIELTQKEVKRLFNSDLMTRKVVGTTQKMILMDSETLMRKILLGLIQPKID